MITTRWIVHCGVCGYLERPEYPAQWVPEKNHAYRFRHKRDAMGVVPVLAEHSRTFTRGTSDEASGGDRLRLNL